MERIGAGAELTFRGVIAQVLRAYREHWRSLLIFGLIVFVPLGVLDVASEHLGEPLLEEDAEFDAGTLAALIVTIFGLSLGSLVGEVVFTGIVSAAVADWRAGRERSVREVLGHLPIGRLICVDLLWAAVTFAGFLALIVPGVIFLVWFALVAPACELEDRGIVDSFRRSRELVRRRFRLAFAIVLMMIAAQQLLTSGAVELATSLFGEGVVEEWIASVLTELAVSPLWALSAVTLFLGLRDYPSRAQTASA